MRDQKVMYMSLLLVLGWMSFVKFEPIYTFNIQGELQYFIGVQLDGSGHVEPLRNRLSDNTEKQSAKLVYFCCPL